MGSTIVDEPESVTTQNPCINIAPNMTNCVMVWACPDSAHIKKEEWLACTITFGCYIYYFDAVYRLYKFYIMRIDLPMKCKHVRIEQVILVQCKENEHTRHWTSDFQRC